MRETVRILYVHGYLGSGNGNSSKLIKSEFVNRGISVALDAPQFPVTKPKDMKECLRVLIEGSNYDYVVASSLGAFYVMQIPDVKKILVNIALPDNLRQLKTVDPDNNPELTRAFLSFLEGEKEKFFSEVYSDGFKRETFIIYGTRDKIAPNEAFFKPYYNAENMIAHLDMDHKLDIIGARKVVEIINDGEI